MYNDMIRGADADAFPQPDKLVLKATFNGLDVVFPNVVDRSKITEVVGYIFDTWFVSHPEFERMMLDALVEKNAYTLTLTWEDHEMEFSIREDR